VARLTDTARELLRISLATEAWRSVRDYAGATSTRAQREAIRRALNTLTSRGLLSMQVRNGHAEWRRPVDTSSYTQAVQLVLT
jgi:hypothetical protein